MANYLYYAGGSNALPSSIITGTYEFSSYNVGAGVIEPSQNLVISGGTYNAQPTGEAYGSGGINPGYNGSDNWTKWFNPAGFLGSSTYFSIGCVDNDIQGDLTFPLALEGFNDRTGATQDIVSHHGSLDDGVYTVLLPSSVTKFGSTLDCSILVWYIPALSLGAGSNAIGLPVKSQLVPQAADSDIEAASKLLFSGLGVFVANNGNHDAYGWAPVG